MYHFSGHSLLLTEHTQINIPCIARHGICHGCTDIIREKFVVTGVKCSYEHVQYVVNSLTDAFLFCFSQLFRCTTRKWV